MGSWWNRGCAALALCLASLVAHAAVDESDLLPVDEAFVLRAQAVAPDRIAVEWQIAEGYYLYRHRIAVQATDALIKTGALQLPRGKKHTDEFFGEVETYRGTLTATLPEIAADPGQPITLRVKYQGCAEAGVCYPPQTRTLTIAMPGDARPAKDDSFAALGRSPGGANKPLFGATPGSVDALPLPPEQAFGFEAIAGDGNTLLLRFTPARGYYLYRDRTRLQLKANGIALRKPRWPKGISHHDEHFGDVIVYFDQVDVPVPLRRTRADAQDIALTATFQGCQTDGICYPPMTRTVRIALPRGTITPNDEAVDTADAGNEVASPSLKQAVAHADATTTTDATATQPLTVDPAVMGAAGTSAARASTAAAGDLSVAPRGANLNLLSALLLALIGGLILNLMPCVLPVLSLKALSLAGSGEDPARARRHALWYTAGVMLSFAVLGVIALALRQAGLALGWGFQLQQPLVVASLALLMFGLGLSLSGVWHLGGRWTGVGHALTTRSGAAGDFFTGVLAVVVATPCTAPFMGAALAWAFTAAAGTAIAVFFALGLGLALPFLLIGFIPALARRLPRPGLWMETFKQVLAFPLYLTAAWLAWVLARQRGADAIGWWLLAAILLAFAAWAWTRSRSTGQRWASIAAMLAAIAMLWPLRVIQTLPRPETAGALSAPSAGIVPVPFSEQRLADLRASHRVVFVNMTADWCVTCKANEKAVFNREAFRKAMADANAVYMVGDWTDVDPALTAFLQRYKAVGVPLYVVFPRGGGEGHVLPTVLTSDVVRKALTDAARTTP